MNHKQYSIDYIARVTTNDEIEAPSVEKAGEFFDTLQALHENHCAGGAKGAKAGWNALKKYVPELAKTRKLIQFHELGFMPLPGYILPESSDGEAPNYALYGKGLNLLYGSPGSGKSFVAIDIAARIALAYPKHSVIYSAGEGKPGLLGRLKAWELHNNSQPIKNLYLWSEALPFMEADEVAQFVDDVRDIRPCFMIVDTLARSMLGLNENDTKEMGLFIKSVENVMEELDLGVMLIHHTNKLGLMRGSSALNGALDSVLKLEKADSVIKLWNSFDKGGKNKHREEADGLFFRLRPLQVDGKDEAVLIRSAKVIDTVEEDNLTDNQISILQALAAQSHGSAMSMLTKETGVHRTTAYRNLQKLIDAGLVKFNPSHDLYTITDKGKSALEK